MQDQRLTRVDGIDTELIDLQRVDVSDNTGDDALDQHLQSILSENDMSDWPDSGDLENDDWKRDMEDLLHDEANLFLETTKAISDELDTVEEKVDTVPDLVKRVEALQLQVDKSAWLPTSSDDYAIIERVQRVSRTSPFMFDEATKHGFLPACKERRRALIESIESAEEDTEILKDVKIRWQKHRSTGQL
jgi:hypothetical protein